MKASNLAERLEEFAATVSLIDASEAKPSPALAIVPGIAPPARRRPKLGTRRIEIRDQGLRPFRVS